MRGLLRTRLSDSYEVMDTSDAEEALGLALDRRPDAVLVDLMMPKSNGFALCQGLQSVTSTAHIPVFAITEKNGKESNHHYRDLGVLACFETPIDPEEIKERLKHVLSGLRPRQRAHVRIRMRTILKIKGNTAKGKQFEELIATENVSAGGFLCNSTTSMDEGAVVDVYLASQPERFAGRAKVVHKETFVASWLRYGFQFEERTKEWVLQD